MKWLLAIVEVVLGLALATFAHAAPLNFLTAESITLSSPPTTLTIATGSVADALGTNATSVFVTLSQTTGGNFTLLSSSYDLSVATSTGGGSITISCSSGIEAATLSQSTGSTVYTVTPGGTNCASASPPVITSIAATGITTTGATITWTTNIAADSTVSYGTTPSYGATSTDPTLVTAHSILLSNLNASTLYHYAVASADYGTSTISGDNTFTAAAIASGGGGSSDSVGVSSQYGLPYTPGAGTNAVSGTPSATATITTTATSSLEAELNALLAELATLQARAGSSGSSLSHSVFTRNLSLGMTGNDVTELQLFLISEASGPATAKLKAHGTTKTFGILTFNALKEFQTKAGIKPAIGYFGPKTRAWVNTAEE